MIISHLNDLHAYEALHPRFPEAFAYLEQLLKEHAADGHHVPAGAGTPEAFYVNISTNQNQPMQEAVAEMHRKYIDVQVLLQGDERMYVPSGVTPEISRPYQPANDCAFYAPCQLEQCHCVLAREGDIVIFFAGEPHAPSGAVGETPATVRKAVLKVLA